MTLPRRISRQARLAGAVLALALAAAACGTAPGGQSNELAATDLTEVLPDGLFEALENVANPPEVPTPEPTAAVVQPDGAAETLVPAQSDDDGQELSEEELLKLRDEAFVDFSRCIRDEGFPDFPDIDSSRIVDQASFIAAMQEAGVSFTEPGLAPALQTCASVFSELIALAPQEDTNVQQAEQEENAVAFSKCMRDQGLDDFPDPDFNQFPGSGFDASGNNAADIDDDTRDALRVCLPVIGGGSPNAVATPPSTAPSPSAQIAAPSTPSTSESTASAQSTTTAQPATSGTDTATTPATPAATARILRDTEELKTAEVVRRDLIDTEEFDGTLGFGDPEPLYTNTSGVVTGLLPDEGEVLDAGDTLFEVNGYPIVVLRGERPMFRPFSNDMEDGPDVQQLEQALADMELPGWENMTINENFTPVTEDLVEEWQNRLGVEETGRIDLGFVVFVEKPFRISSVNVTPGQQVSPQAAAFSVTGRYQEIVSNIDPGDAEIVNEDDDVEVELPDGRVSPGVVWKVARVAERLAGAQGGLADPTIEVIIILLDEEASSRFDAAPVKWTITKEVTPDALVVPASALIATVDGGFSVEVVTSGSTRLVPVEVGKYVDAFVEITGGNLQEGDQVRIP